MPHGVTDEEADLEDGGWSVDKEGLPAARKLYWSIMAGEIPLQLFEQRYLSSRPRSPPPTPPDPLPPNQAQKPPQVLLQNQVDLRKMFPSPTPLGVLGFCVSATPLSIAFMTWRGSGGQGVATGAAGVWFGGVLLLVAGIFEFILGNFFPFIAFMAFGAHFLTFATTFMPSFNALGYYTGTSDADGVITAAHGQTPAFQASFAYYTLSMCIVSTIFALSAIRTNLIFVLWYFFSSVGYCLETVGYFKLSTQEESEGSRLMVGAGACFFGAVCLGWYLLCSMMISIMELPFPELPVFDLSNVIGAKESNSKR